MEAYSEERIFTPNNTQNQSTVSLTHPHLHSYPHSHPATTESKSWDLSGTYHRNPFRNKESAVQEDLVLKPSTVFHHKWSNSKALQLKPALPALPHTSPSFPKHLNSTLSPGSWRQIWAFSPVSLLVDLRIKPFLFSKVDVIVLALCTWGSECLLGNKSNERTSRNYFYLHFYHLLVLVTISPGNK